MSKHNKDRGSNRRPSLDGFVSDGRGLGVPAHRSYQPNRGHETPSIGDSLRRADGFHPLRQSSGQPLGSTPDGLDYLEEPIVLEQEDPKKARKRAKMLKKQRRHQSRRRRVIKRAFALLLILAVAGLGALAYKFYDAQRNILAGGGRAPAVCNGDVPVQQLKTEGDGRVNILLVGIGGPEHAAGSNLTDSLMVASMDTVNNKTDLLSVPRDLWVRVPGNGSTKINATYFYGLDESSSDDTVQQQRDGLNLLDKTLKPVIGVDIHYHFLVDFAAFRETVNAIGGVDVVVPKDLAVSERLWDEATGRHYNLNVPPGQQHFDGTRALFFARQRQGSSDFERSERQRLMLLALKDKILSAGTFANPIAIVSLLDGLGENVYTDFDTGSIKCLYTQISQISSSDVKSLDMVTPPNDYLTTANLNGTSIVRPKDGLFEYGDILTYVRKSFRDGFLARENSPVAVYNATSSDGLATEQADLLKEYGYNVKTVDSIPAATNPAKTVLVDLSDGKDKYTLNYLQRRYGLTARGELPAGSPTVPDTIRFVIILGRDVADADN